MVRLVKNTAKTFLSTSTANPAKNDARDGRQASALLGPYILLRLSNRAYNDGYVPEVKLASTPVASTARVRQHFNGDEEILLPSHFYRSATGERITVQTLSLQKQAR
jgi:hypothetical protein